MIGDRDFPRARFCSFCGRIPLFGGSMVVASAGAVCADCLKVMHRITGRSRSWRGGGATPQHLLEELSQKVVGRTHAKRVLAVAGYLHHKRRLGWREEGTDLPKANILLIGPPAPAS
jgi:ATP-dependent Clp protease ATP-binding subunit ClpX